MSKPEWRAIVLSIIAAGAGLFLAFTRHDGTCFSRSGAAIGVIAVFFAYQRIPAGLEKKVQEFLAKELSKARIFAAGGAGTTEDTAKNVEAEIHQEVGEVLAGTIKRLLRVEAWLFVGGTIIWGFGDIPFNYVWPACTCSGH